MPRIIAEDGPLQPMLELPYGAVPPFRLMSVEDLVGLRAKIDERMGAGTSAGKLFVRVVLCKPKDIYVDKAFSKDVSWSHVIKTITKDIKNYKAYDKSKRITSVAFSSRSTWLIYSACMRVVDTRLDAPPPAAVLPNGAVVYVALVQRENGWLPTIVGLRGCHKCGVPECNDVQLRECGRCRKVMYCSSECQNADWPVHKQVCTQAGTMHALAAVEASGILEGLGGWRIGHM